MQRPGRAKGPKHLSVHLLFLSVRIWGEISFQSPDVESTDLELPRYGTSVRRDGTLLNKEFHVKKMSACVLVQKM